MLKVSYIFFFFPVFVAVSCFRLIVWLCITTEPFGIEDEILKCNAEGRNLLYVAPLIFALFLFIYIIYMLPNIIMSLSGYCQSLRKIGRDFLKVDEIPGKTQILCP